MAEVLKEPFLRPNPQNQGTLPDGTESTCECPDIWCAGDTPIFDFQKNCLMITISPLILNM